MSSTDYLRLNEFKIFKELRESLPKTCTKTQNLITVHDNVLFTWDFQNHCVLSLNLKAARGKEGDNVIHQKLLPLHPPLFTPECVTVNQTGSLLAISGSSGILVLELPSRCPPFGSFQNNKEVVYCKAHSLDERLLSCSELVKLRKLQFHPGSPNHSHIVALTSDNSLRLYQVENGEVRNLAVYSVGEKPSTLFPGTTTTFLDIYGEVAIDFDFGLPEIQEIIKPAKCDETKSFIKGQTRLVNTETQTPNKIVANMKTEKKKDKQENDAVVWPVFILRSDLSIYKVSFDLKLRWKPIIGAPLAMSYTAEEQIDACSIICLNTVPQIMCISLCDGSLLHAVCSEVESSKSGSRNYPAAVSEQELFVFEKVQLELGLTTCEEDQGNNSKCTVQLKKDEVRPERYYALHGGGIHSVVISCIDGLQQFINAPEAVDPTSDIFIEPSKAEYLVCTKKASSLESIPVIGFALYYEPTSIITLLGDGRLVTLGILLSTNLPNIEDLKISDDTVVSPLKKMLQEPFTQYIESILKKTSTHPVLKLQQPKEGTQEECYELLQRTAQCFRDEYFKNHIKVKDALEKRIKTLTIMKRNQQNEIENMKLEREMLRDKASNLAEKYEDIKDKQDELLKKSENLLMLVSRRRSSPSAAEQEFVKELDDCSRKIAMYHDRIDKVKNKMKYQQIQMENWKSQEVKKIGTINEKHTSTIKTNLTDTTKKISEMVRKINEYKVQLDLQ
ncbi:nuclear pore complex protein Nup88 [Diabrotica undecimpunctata]|uniref:nuclear pore complex protein Nup88 n=1 Tax=Diabrotica undecimpunctata TaxID=50387 RepID=UPI003B634F8C